MEGRLMKRKILVVVILSMMVAANVCAQESKEKFDKCVYLTETTNKIFDITAVQINPKTAAPVLIDLIEIKLYLWSSPDPCRCGIFLRPPCDGQRTARFVFHSWCWLLNSGY